MDYKDVAPTLQTGDVMLFRGTTAISIVIMEVTRSEFSHAGMVVRASDNSLYMWQSFEPQGGVVWDPLEDFLNGYEQAEHATFIVRHLLGTRSPAMLAALDAFKTEVLGRPSPGTIEALADYILGRNGIDTGENKLFCSALVADTYMHMGLLPKSPPNAFAPGTFSSKFPDLPWQQGMSLGPQIEITMSGSATGAGT